MILHKDVIITLYYLYLHIIVFVFLHPAEVLVLVLCTISFREYNLALGKVARQVDTYQHDAIAERAIDGCRRPLRYTASCCSHTLNPYQPWWELDLGAPYTIGKVVIYRRYEESCMYLHFPFIFLIRVM